MDFTQEHIDSWRSRLEVFDDAYRHIFKPAGISRDAAFIVWHLNITENEIIELREAIENDRC